jgi:CBS domain containing-hemolysin-like protein
LDIPLSQYILLLTSLILVSAFISGSKKAFSVLDRAGIESMARVGKSQALRFLAERPSETLLTFLIIHSLLLIVMVFLTLLTFQQGWLRGGIFLIVVITYLYLGRVLPRALVQGRELGYISRVSFIIRFLYSVISPFRIPLERISAVLFNEKRGLKMPLILDRDFKNLVVAASDEVEEMYEREMIHNVMEFRETRVKEVMTPRPDMFCLDVEEDLASVLQKVRDYRFSRIPVYREDLDHIEGILYTKELLPLLLQEVALDRKLLLTLLHPAMHVPETKRVSELLREFKKQNVHIAMVVDEYGGVEGLVCLEDLLEEIVGEIQDEGDVEEKTVQKIGEHTYRISAMLPLEEFNALFDSTIESEDYETIGGFVLDRLGHFPKWGEKVRYEDLEIVVYRSRGVRILELLASRQTQGEDDMLEQDD